MVMIRGMKNFRDFFIFMNVGLIISCLAEILIDILPFLLHQDLSDKYSLVIPYRQPNC